MPAFIAKGMVAIDSRLTENRGYDLILDRSSIKGWGNNTGPMQVSQVKFYRSYRQCHWSGQLRPTKS
ncbi:MAG: hypothetical protein AAFR77_06470 [Cyanobacteria bacterium J06631_2]